MHLLFDSQSTCTERSVDVDENHMPLLFRGFLLQRMLKNLCCFRNPSSASFYWQLLFFNVSDFFFQKSQYTQNIKDNTIFFYYGHFWSSLLRVFNQLQFIIDGFPINMHRTQLWCRSESTYSSASWSFSLKNAERHKFFQKSQFCFFSFSSLIIHCRCRTFITELIYQRSLHSFCKVI